MICLLVDDEPLLLRRLQRTVAEVIPEADIYAYTNAKEALSFAENSKIDIAFLDIRIRGTDGIELAKKLVKKYPMINIIFCTGYSEYALKSYDTYASDYLLKPITAEQIKKALGHLRYPVETSKRVKIKCFGNFDAYCDGEPIQFGLTKTYELFAYLVDRNGAICRTREIISVLFEDNDNREYYKKLRQDFLHTFEKLGITDCLYIERGGLGIRRKMVECDYFDYRDGKITAIPDEYMTQYSFGEITFSSLLK